MKNAITLIAVVILNLYMAVQILNIKSDWALFGAICYVITIVILTNRAINYLLNKNTKQKP